MHQPKIVTLGGGTMHARIAGGIVQALSSFGYTDKQIDACFTAFVTTTDKGGSTGKLLDQYRKIGTPIPGVGDMRNVISGILEVTGQYDLATQLSARDESGNAWGNLALVDAWIHHGPTQWMHQMKQARSYAGTILPMSQTPVDLMVQIDDETTLLGDEGDHSIEQRGAEHPGSIIDPVCCTLVSRTGKPIESATIVDALLSADIIILCGGRPYTSVLPPLLVPGVREAIQQNSSAALLMFTNASTRYNQSHNRTNKSHIAYFHTCIGRKPDSVIINSGNVAGYTYEDMVQHNNTIIPYIPEELTDYHVIAKDLLMDTLHLTNARPGHLVLHDPKKIASLFQTLLAPHLPMSTLVQPIVIVSGGFDPVHVGHIEYFQEAAKIGRVIVALNSDERLTRKKGKPFMKRAERRVILLEMKSISEVIAFEDDDEGSACDGIRKIASYYAGSGTKIYFAKGGDRAPTDQEKNLSKDVQLCHDLGIEVIYDVGKSGKIQSSSRLLKEYQQ